MSLGLWLVSPLAIMLGRHWLVERVRRSVQHTFDEKLEHLKSELRQGEAQVKAAIDAKESEIAALRSQVLSASARRSEILDRRRLDAVDKTWAAVGALAPYRVVSEMFLRINLKEVEASPRSPNMGAFFARIASIAPADVPKEVSAHAEQLYLSPLAWAYFNAYQTVLIVQFGMVKGLEFGLQDVRKFVRLDRLKDILTLALPADASFIKDCEPTDFAILLGDLEKALLAELQSSLEGREADAAEIDRASKINDAVKKGFKQEPAANGT